MYFLPVNINERRIHYCELANEYEDQQIIFNFLVQKVENTSLFLLKSDSLLISDEKSSQNVPLNNLEFSLKSSNDNGSTFEYKLSAKPGRMNRKVLRSDDEILVLADIGDGDIRLGVDIGKIKKNDENRNFINLKLNIEYIKNDSSKYSCSLTFVLYNRPDDVISAALDFGSEASQIRIGTSLSNVPLVETFLEVANTNQDNKYSMDGRYWQREKNDQYFKSIFHINCKPEQTKLAEKPMANGAKTFIQVLNTLNKDETKELELLPNLKLLELYPSVISNKYIEFPEGTDEKIRAKNPQLSDREQQDIILHYLITSFLHALLYSIQKNNDKRKLLLQFAVLSPNVYSQKKVYGIVEKLYRDFSIIKEQNLYPSIIGIEVQTISESDASFLGYVATHARSFQYSGKNYYLIIDAGKGTTDFSVIKETGNRTKFDSLLRCGIPAAGNAITYSFFEALCKIQVPDNTSDSKTSEEDLSQTAVHSFLTIGDVLKKDLKDYSQLLDLQQNLDELKKIYSNSKDVISEKNAATQRDTSIKDLSEINGLLGNVLQGEEKIPDLDTYVEGENSSVSLLTNVLRDSLQIVKTLGVKFKNVLFTGRCFSFKPFAESVITMLCDEQLIDNPDQVMRPDADEAKSICMNGAIQILNENNADINHKSLLTGSPVIDYEKNSPFRFFGIRGKNINEPIPLDENFYFKGLLIEASNGFVFQLNNRILQIEGRPGGVHNLFFVGRTFLEQGEGRVQRLTFPNDQLQMDNMDNSDKIKSLVQKSLFPFNLKQN